MTTQNPKTTVSQFQFFQTIGMVFFFIGTTCNLLLMIGEDKPIFESVLIMAHAALVFVLAFTFQICALLSLRKAKTQAAEVIDFDEEGH